MAVWRGEWADGEASAVGFDSSFVASGKLRPTFGGKP
jgi:hypothetical protein